MVSHARSSQPERMGITAAGLALGMSYMQIQRLLLIGRLRGGRDGSRYWVDADSVEEFRQTRDAAPRAA
jgi:hypothetical protein